MSMDVLYYSNYCLHSKKILQYLAKEGLTNQLNCICIDRRTRDPKTGQIYITLENGKQLMMPPNVHSVPAMLLVKENFRVILGEEIKLNRIKLIKIIKNGGIKSIINNYKPFISGEMNIKFQFDIFHGSGNIEKAINILDKNEQNDFYN
jgi:hypothetical protein